MSPLLVLVILLLYFGVLILISFLTSRKASTDTFFTGNHQSPWYVVAYGMIGASLSGITFVSVPGNVGKVGFGYLQVVLGYLVGYWVIITLLLPLYYKLNLVSIYTYLEQRFNVWSYKTGAFFFLLSRLVSSSLRLGLSASILQLALFDAWNVPFYITVSISLLLIWIYTYRGGIKTIVWTDLFQTTFLLGAVVICVYLITNRLELSFSDMSDVVYHSRFSRIFYWDDTNSPLFFPKQFLGGAFIAIAMTGLDQDLMQKNLTCRTLRESQKNMFWFSASLLVVNLLFLTLGALLYLYCEAKGLSIPPSADALFPSLALHEFGLLAGIFFLLGIVASTYASADSALAGLTTSFCIDFLHFNQKPEVVKQRQKNLAHAGFSILILIIVLVFREINQRSLIDAILILTGYTYGPILGLFSFGLFTRRQLREKAVPLIAVMAPLISYGISSRSVTWMNGYTFGFEIIIVNGLLMFLGLWMISYSGKDSQVNA